MKKCLIRLICVPFALLFCKKRARADRGNPKRELRAVWIASVNNIDWPTRTGAPADVQQAEFISQLEETTEMGMNAVVVQIKPTADSFYPSEYGPWSEYLTGVQGGDPGYDPLAFMIREAHKRNLEFHAWVNPYRITMNHTDLNRLADGHPARENPEWIVAYGNQLYFDPGIPEVQQFLIDGVNEIVSNYDVDAIHMDDYFYPYPVAGQQFPDDSSFSKYGTDFSNRADWRRNNVNTLVASLQQSIKAEKRHVKFGISPFGVWRNVSTDPTGSNTQAGVENYDDLYADTRQWIQQGSIDYITPQIYWNIGFAAAAFDVLIDWWKNETAESKTHFYVGQAAYKIGVNSVPEWHDPEEYPRQIAYLRERENVHGSIHFSLKDLRANRLGSRDRLIQDEYAQPALIPVMPWLGGEAPPAPQKIMTERADHGISITIHDESENAFYYAVYRFEGSKAGSVDDEESLLGTVRKTGSKTTFIDEGAESGQTYTYVVSAFDRLHHESSRSERTIR